MAKYYYTKYTYTSETLYSNEDPSFTLIGEYVGRRYGNTTYSFTAGTKGYDSYGLPFSNPYETYIYSGSGATVNMYWNDPSGTYIKWEKGCDSNTTYYNGWGYIATVEAEEGTYPADGYQSGYWWVKGAAVQQNNGAILLFL